MANTIAFFRKKIDRVPFFLLCLICFFPLFKIEFTSKVVFLFFTLSIVVKFKDSIQNFKETPVKHILINSGFYVFLIFTLTYSSDIGIAQKTIIRQSSLLLFPITIFYFVKPSRSEIIVLGKIFVLANFFTCLYLIGFVLNYYDVSNWNTLSNAYAEFDFRGVINNDTLKEWHPGYIGLFILTSILILIEGLYSRSKKTGVFVNIILLLFFSTILLLLNTRGVLYASALILPLYFILKAKTRKKRMFTLIVCIIIFGLIGFFITNNYSLNYRLTLQIEKVVDWITTGKISESGIDSRYYINKCNWALFTEKPFFGYGIGDIKYNLNNCYLDKEFFGVFEKRFNSHSIFFYLLLCGGILTIIPFVILIFNNLRLSYLKKDSLYFFIIILLCIIGVSENYLVRLNGILFFSLFNSILYYNLIANNKPA
jgi:hypothetical protein